MSNELQVGDCAVLLSGGPKMVITEVDKKGICRCYWMLENSVTNYEDFPTVCLKKVKPEH